MVSKSQQVMGISRTPVDSTPYLLPGRVWVKTEAWRDEVCRRNIAVEIPGTKLLVQKRTSSLEWKFYCEASQVHSLESHFSHSPPHWTMGSPPCLLGKQEGTWKIQGNWFFFLQPPQAGSYLLFTKWDGIFMSPSYKAHALELHSASCTTGKEDLVQLCSCT